MKCNIWTVLGTVFLAFLVGFIPAILIVTVVYCSSQLIRNSLRHRPPYRQPSARKLKKAGIGVPNTGVWADTINNFK